MRTLVGKPITKFNKEELVALISRLDINITYLKSENKRLREKNAKIYKQIQQLAKDGFHISLGGES